MDGEGINGHSKVFGVDLGEALSSRVVSASDKHEVLHYVAYFTETKG